MVILHYFCDIARTYLFEHREMYAFTLSGVTMKNRYDLFCTVKPTFSHRSDVDGHKTSIQKQS